MVLESTTDQLRVKRSSFQIEIKLMTQIQSVSYTTGICTSLSLKCFEILF